MNGSPRLSFRKSCGLCFVLVVSLFYGVAPIAAKADTRVCNKGNIPINLAYAYERTPGIVMGWFSLDPGKCRTESFSYWLTIVHKTATGGLGIGFYDVPAMAPIYTSNRKFCIHPENAFKYIPSGSSCPGGLVSAQFPYYFPAYNGMFPPTLNVPASLHANTRSISSGECDRFASQGENLYRSGRTAEAVTYFSKAIEADKNCARAFIDRSIVYNSKNDHAKEMADLDAAIAISAPEQYANRAHAAYERAMTKIQLKEWDSADRDCELSAKFNPRSGYQYACHGWIIFRRDGSKDRKTLEQSLDFLTRAIALEPSKGMWRSMRADVYDALGMKAAAISDCRAMTKPDGDCRKRLTH
jgi:hypothetical protein